ncbi:MAG: GspH/FimT family pseudopilin [Gallionella sp.]
MLNALPTGKSLGFTLIELMIGITIFAIAMAMGVPSYQTWMQNTQIRNAAESIQNGLQRARSEAVKGNTNVFFRLDTNSGWTIASGVPATPNVIETRSANEGSRNVTRTVLPAGATIITYGSLGTPVPNADASAPLTEINLDSSVLGAADSRDLRVALGVGGNPRMCDPNLTAGTVGAC